MLSVSLESGIRPVLIGQEDLNLWYDEAWWPVTFLAVFSSTSWGWPMPLGAQDLYCIHHHGLLDSNQLTLKSALKFLFLYTVEPADH